MAYFHCLIGGGSSGGGYELTVTCDAGFAGTTITATDGVTTLTQTCPSASPYEVVFAIPNGGEWTISGIVSGQTYSTAIDIPDSLELSSVPEGSTVLPTDDIQTWLECAGIRDKSYTTLNEVLSDSTTLLALMSNNNAVDYLVRSTTWASGITADSTAMTDIGANNYCANTLLSDSTWLDAIANSTYIDSVLNVKVPTMTSNTTPKGEAYCNSAYGTLQAFYVFDRNIETGWHGAQNIANAYVAYIYEEKQIIKAFSLRIHGTFGGTKNITIFGANTGDPDVTVLYTAQINVVANVDYELVDTFSNDTAFDYYGIRFTEVMFNGSIYMALHELQFYGREDV